MTTSCFSTRLFFSWYGGEGRALSDGLLVFSSRTLATPCLSTKTRTGEPGIPWRRANVSDTYLLQLVTGVPGKLPDTKPLPSPPDVAVGRPKVLTKSTDLRWASGRKDAKSLFVRPPCGNLGWKYFLVRRALLDFVYLIQTASMPCIPVHVYSPQRILTCRCLGT